MLVKKVYLVACLFIGIAYSSSAFSAKIQPVYSLKNLGDHTSAAGVSFQKVQIKCNPDMRLRYIHRNSGADNWCANGDSKRCFSDRIEAATSACSNRAAPQSIASTPEKELKPAPTSSAEELKAQAERKKLEEELLATQQKKIELRSRQLELRKRELELQAQKDNS